MNWNSSEAREAFRQEGFVLMKGVLKESAIRDAYHSLLGVLKKYCSAVTPELYAELKSAKPFSDPRLSETMIRFRAESPQFFGALYDTVQSCVSLQNIVCDHQVAEIAATLLGDDFSGMSATGQMMRMDAPQDKRNALDWHQEISYYDQNLSPENGLVMWTPLHDVRLEHGPVIVCPQSHHEGHIKVDSVKQSEASSEQFSVPLEYVKKYKELSVIANAGDVLFFSMNLFHRSGDNISKQIRFVAGVRYHRMFEADYMPGRLIYTPNKTVGRSVR